MNMGTWVIPGKNIGTWVILRNEHRNMGNI